MSRRLPLHRALGIALLPLGLLIAACSSTTGGSPDGGRVADSGACPEGGVCPADAALDSGTDAGFDSGADSGVGAGVDSSADAGLDSSAEAGCQTSSDCHKTNPDECTICTDTSLVCYEGACVCACQIPD